MKSILFLMISAAGVVAAKGQSVLDLVNPFIGTTNAEHHTRWGAEGGTYPGAVAPWGMIQLSPETKSGHRRGYDYRDSLIYFFSCANHSSGYPNGSAGSMKVMPLPAQSSAEHGAAGRPFTHNNENASPAYYRVQFSDDNAVAEMTTAVRTGMFRFKFPAGVSQQIFLGEMGKLVQKSKRLIVGERLNVVLAFAADIVSMEPIGDDMIVKFSAKPGDNSILMKIGLSTVNTDGSLRNMKAECPDWSFEKFLAANQQRWVRLLGKVAIEDPSTDNKIKFYTALYHSLLVPTVTSDVDGQYRGAGRKVYRTKGKNQYSKFSPWDTYRSVHPLLNLLVPDVQADMIRSMLDVFEQTGRLPKGPMTGYHSLPVILDSWRKGVRGFDSAVAWTAMKSSLDSTLKEPDFSEYRRRGYVSSLFSESVTKTVEFAYNDWVMAEMARDMQDSAAFGYFAAASQNYKNLLHYATGFMVPRNGEEFFPDPENRGYKEGDKWIYSFAVPHDARGLVNLMGGDSLFVSLLDSALSTGLLLFDNEPAFHVPYLFNFSNRPSLSQSWLREIMGSYFTARPGGIPGNDDLGSMSSWFVFSAMGFYPVAVGLPSYEIGSPLFKKIVVQLPAEKELVITAPDNSSGNIFVNGLKLNGRQKKTLSVSHQEIFGGAKLHFDMGAQAADQYFQSRDFEGRSLTTRRMEPAVESYRIANTSVEPHENVWLHYTIRNRGAMGKFAANVFGNQKIIANNATYVEADSRAADSIAFRLYEPGVHKIKLNDAPEMTVTVVLPAVPPKKRIEVNSLEARPIAKVGEQQQFTCLVKNITGLIDTAVIQFSLDGEIFKTERLVLRPGEQRKIAAFYVPGKPGIQALQAGDEKIMIACYRKATETKVLDAATENSQPNDVIRDMSGMGNHGRSIVETRRMADNSIDTIRYVQFQNSGSLDELEDELTVMAWVHPGKQKGMADIVSKGDHIVFQQSRTMLSFFAGGWGQGSCDVRLPEDWENKWHHIVGVCKGREFRVYIDGVEAGSYIVDRPVRLASRLRWVVGGNEEFPDQRYFNGKIDRFKVYLKALSGAEIRQATLHR